MKADTDYLAYCIKYQNDFPEDLKTATDFIELGYAIKARLKAKSRSEFDAINKCLDSAKRIYILIS